MEVSRDVLDDLYGLAHNMAKNYPANNLFCDREDLIQEAVIAALPILDRYDPAKGSLRTFVYRRMQGAMKDVIRDYMKSRRTNGGYKDCRTFRFSQIEQFSLEKLIHHKNDIRPDCLTGWVCMDNRELAPDYLFGLQDSLDTWRKEHKIGNKDWIILWYRFALEFSQMEVADLLGMCHSAISRRETILRNRFRIIEKIRDWRKRKISVELDPIPV